MSDKLLTIVIPSYNQGKYIERTLQSVLAQKTDDIEVFVIDGGSSDNSVSIIKKYSSSLDYWVSEPDNGQSHAFNKGFRRATGHYLTWVNSDDLLLEGSIKAFRKFVLQNGRPDWVAANSMWIDVADIILRCTVNAGWNDYQVQTDALTVTGPSSFFSKELLKTVGCVNEDYHYSMDIELWYRFAKSGARFKTMNHFVWALRLHPEAKVSGADFNKQHPGIKILNEETELTRAHYYPRFFPGNVHWIKLVWIKLRSGAKLKSILMTTLKKDSKAPVDAFLHEQ